MCISYLTPTVIIEKNVCKRELIEFALITDFINKTQAIFNVTACA